MYQHRLRLAPAIAILLLLAMPGYAYLDPGTTGALFQMGYVVFYSIIGFFAFLGRPFIAMIKGRKAVAKANRLTQDDKPNDDAESSTVTAG